MRLLGLGGARVAVVGAVALAGAFGLVCGGRMVRAARGGPMGRGRVSATAYPGSDMGQRIDRAIADIGCGTVMVPEGVYSISTTIVKPRCIWLRGAGAPATTLAWRPRVGAAVVVGDDGGSGLYPAGGIADLAIRGPGGAYGAGSEGIGVALGGDPAGRVDPPGFFADFQRFEDLRVSNFGLGVRWGSNAWLDEFRGVQIMANGVGISEAVGAVNSAEQNRFEGGALFNNRVALQRITVDTLFDGTSFDYNLNPGGGTIIDSSLRCRDCHFEQERAPVIDNSGAPEHVWLSGGMFSITGLGGRSEFVVAAKGQGSVLDIEGMEVYASYPIREFVRWAGGPGDGLSVGGLAGDTNGEVRSLFQRGFSVPAGARIFGPLPQRLAAPR